MDQLGINIRKLRKSRGMTQEELADDSGTTKQSILKIEKGETIPLSTTLYCIASSLGTSVETLFGEDIEFLESSENIVLDVLRNQYSFIELHRSIFTETKEDKLDKYGLENERKLLLSELDIDNMSNQDLYQLILIKQKNELENARKKYLKARVNHTMENNYINKEKLIKDENEL